MQRLALQRRHCVSFLHFSTLGNMAPRDTACATLIPTLLMSSLYCKALQPH
jgi:hypothetical protein